ncbi:MAG: SRPBCC family protein [Solirubrobacterales bacterium]
MIATTALWITVGVLGCLLIAVVAGSFLLLAMGRLHLDLGWGRSVHQLGPITIRIDAPRELVFEIIAAPYLGRTPGESGIEVLARGDDLAVAAHHTKVHFYTARTVEVLEFDAPARVGFRHLTGPVPHAVERFDLEQADGATELRYTGEVGIDFFVLGRIAGRHWVRPQWERTVREHLEDLKERAELLAARRRGRERG